MPNNEKVMREAHDVSFAGVWPTRTATPTEPAQWRRVSKFSNLPQSSTPEYYAITIFGEAYSYASSQSRDVEIQRVYRALHPSIAVGYAVMRFFKDNCRATIHNIEILKREVR